MCGHVCALHHARHPRNCSSGVDVLGVQHKGQDVVVVEGIGVRGPGLQDRGIPVL